MGDRIRREVLREKRATYGKEIVATLSHKLTHEFGKGWERSALSRMIRFSEAFPDFEIVATLSQQLGWSHFVEIVPMKDDLKRDFYAEMCRIERWSGRKLRESLRAVKQATDIEKAPGMKALAEKWKVTGTSTHRSTSIPLTSGVWMPPITSTAFRCVKKSPRFPGHDLSS